MSLTDKPNYQQSVGDTVAVQIDRITADLLEQLSQAREQLDRAETVLLDQTAKAKQLIAGVVDASLQVVKATHQFAKTVQSLAANNARPLVIETPKDEETYNGPDRDNINSYRTGDKIRSDNRE